MIRDDTNTVTGEKRMDEPIRVLLADDSSAVRRLLTHALSKEPGLEVVGAARNGQELLIQAESGVADVILLDLEMPILDGISTLKELRKTDRSTPVLLFSAMTVRGGEATLEALACGASEYVTKPAQTGHIDTAMEYIRAEVAPRLTNLGHRRRAAVFGQVRERKQTLPTAYAAPQQKADAILIGSSTGGPNALTTILKELPADLGAPVLIVQHMPKLFTRLLAQRLDGQCQLKVRQAVEGAVPACGEVWIAPGDLHMGVMRKLNQVQLTLSDAPAENSCKPSVDFLFRSAAEVYGSRCMASVLTGMGRDGVEGARAIVAKGGSVVTQDEKTSVVWGMPKAVADAGYSSVELSLNQFAGLITAYAGTRSRKLPRAESARTLKAR